jgi:hypothetical protein
MRVDSVIGSESARMSIDSVMMVVVVEKVVVVIVIDCDNSGNGSERGSVY